MNTIGLWYRVWTTGALTLLLGVLCAVFTLLERRRQNKRDRKNNRKKFKKDMIFTCVIVVFGLFIMGYYSYKASFPEIRYFSGSFEDSHRTTSLEHAPFTDTYWFSKENDEKKAFMIDAWSKKEIFNESFEEGKQYGIWYDENTDIILQVEKLE